MHSWKRMTNKLKGDVPYQSASPIRYPCVSHRKQKGDVAYQSASPIR
jgi:hypothetical protein